MSRKKRRVYTIEFKKESAKLALGSEKSTYEISRELGVSYGALNNWISKYTTQSNEKTPYNKLDIEQENKQLKKELSRVKQERDILKKATAYFAGETL